MGVFQPTAEGLYLALSFVFHPRGHMARRWYLVATEMTRDEAYQACLDDRRIQHERTDSARLEAGAVREDAYLVLTWTWAQGLRIIDNLGWRSGVYVLTSDSVPEYDQVVNLCRNELAVRMPDDAA